MRLERAESGSSIYGDGNNRKGTFRFTRLEKNIALDV